jgi:diacylglycerol O-acyltransferase
MTCPAPGDEQALLDQAWSVIESSLPRSAQLWAAMLVTGLADARVALVFVLHHVLADGVGGLTVLANLVDMQPAGRGARFPRQAPTAATLARDAFVAGCLHYATQRGHGDCCAHR